MSQRVTLAREDSDTAAFFDLMYLGELLTKLVVAGFTGALNEDRDRHRYALLHRLVRADGIGEWVESLDEVLVGPASQHLCTSAHDEQRDMTQLFGKSSVAWQRQAVDHLDDVCRILDSATGPTPPRVSLRRWFAQFAWLRNRTRGHGAPTARKCSEVCEELSASITLIASNLRLLMRPWAYLHRNLSGKFRVIPIAGDIAVFDYLKKATTYTYDNGVYVFFDEPRDVPLLQTDVDLSDFFVANGAFQGSSFEMLSYVTDERALVAADAFLPPPTPLPASETEGRPALEVLGNTFANLPPAADDYIRRGDLESELEGELRTDRHPVITLQGPGGAGKTSTALAVLHAEALLGTFACMVWCSARDIDLLPSGAKLVRPRVLSRDDIARFFAELIEPEQALGRNFDALTFFAEHMGRRSTLSPILLIVDNFETVRNPIDVYRWLDATIRLPNKMLITTRYREFKGDYPVEVGGMLEAEFADLARSTAARLGINKLVTEAYIKELFSHTDGHPYVAKVLLGEVAENGKLTPVPRLMADKEAMLAALFERSFQMMAPAAQRVFLTLCNWRSLVPRLALEAALLRPQNEPMDVSAAVDSLVRASLINTAVAVDGEEFLSVPLAAAEFGRKKLAVSPVRSAVEADTDILQSFGAARGTDLAYGLETRVRRLFARVDGLVKKKRDVSAYMPVLEYIARKYPPGWLMLADLMEEGWPEERRAEARDAVRSYLETNPSDGLAWKRLARLYREEGDTLGEIHARVELAEMPAAPFHEVSATANLLNARLRDGSLNLDTEDRRFLVQRLREVMGRRIAEAKASDCSRVAWLCLHLQDHAAARYYVEEGLRRDAQDQYCLRLAERLDKVRG